MTSAGEQGIDVVIDLLTRLAAGDLDAQAPPTGSDEMLDAVIMGVNMLAEELRANRDELEKRVLDRTRELEEARREAQAAARQKSEFLATMSHEIRTPLNGVIGLTTLLLQTPLDETQLRYADGLRHAGDALLHVINDILDFSKLEAGMLDLEDEEVDPRMLLDGVAGLMAAAAEERGLELITHTASSVPTLVIGDEGRLRQILLNFASNAVKFTEKGEVVLSARVAGREPGHCRLRLEVTDTGIGVAEAARETLFDSFTQADPSTTRRYGGTGLGLAISRSLVEAMGGTIGVDSTEGAGSTFWCEVPLAVPPHAPAARCHPALEGVRVLVVDDNATSRSTLVSVLEEWGMRATAVEDPGTAVGLLTRAVEDHDPYAVALLDQEMPGLRGLALAALVSADPGLRDVRVLLMSSREVEDGSLRRAGVHGWVRKPVHGGELASRLASAVPGEAHPPTAGTPRPARRSAADGATRPSAPGDPVMSRGRVLVVEDNPVNQVVAQGLVSQLGYDVDLAENGAEAVDAVAVTDYAAVLMDCHMPVLDGYAATGEIRRRAAPGDRVPIIAMTAGATAEDRTRCLAAGMDDYVAKPVDLSALRLALSTWARGSAPALDHTRLDLLRSLGPGDGGLVGSLADAFSTTTPGMLTAMRRALEAGDGDAVRHAAHELSGVAANLGAVRVAALAREVEAGAADSREALVPLVDRLVPEVELAARLLREAARP